MSGNADLMKAYNRYLRLQRGYSPNTLEAYQRDVKKLFDFLEGESINPLDAKLDDLQQFAASLHDIGIGAKSQCRILKSADRQTPARSAFNGGGGHAGSCHRCL